MYVAEALWLIDGSEMAISASIDGLKSPVVEARRVAAIVLGLVASEGHDTIAPLTAALDDADLKVRTTAAAGLSNFGPAAAGSLPGIERLLGEKDEFALVTAVHAILSIDSSRAEELVPRLATVLKTGSGRSRQRAVEVLGEIPAIGALAVPPLIEALDDEDQDIRSMSMRSLQAIGPLAALAVPNLINILRGLNKHVGDILVRGRAVDALGAIGPAAHEATPHLLAYLPLTLPLSELIRLPTSRPLSQPPSLAAWYFFVRVAHALWRIERDPKHLLSVGLEAIRHPKWLVRNLAVERLGDLGAAGQPAIAHLRQCLQDERLGVRLSARQSLEKIERG